MKTKCFRFIMALLMIAVMAGCQGNTTQPDAGQQGTPSGEQAASANTQKESNNFNLEGFPIVNEKITLRVMWGHRSIDTLESYNKMYATQKLEELTNININAEMVNENDWDTKLNLMFASGDYSDVIINSQRKVNFEEYGATQKLLLPLDDLVDQYMPIYKSRAEAEPTDVLIGLRASNGQIYSVGFFSAQNINASAHYFINKTWLETLNLEIPKTVNQLTDVLRAFKTGDPNGNGQADEVPYQTMFTLNNSGMNAIFAFWGLPVDMGENYFFVDDNKQVQFAPYQQGFREAVEWMNLLHREGLLDVEFISQDATMLESKITDGKAGFFTAWRLLGAPYTEWAKENAIVMDPVVADGYEVRMPKTMEYARNGAYITVGNKYVPETMRWLDAQLETEMMFTMFYGEENVGWKYNEDGRIVNIENTGASQMKTALDVNALFFAPGNYYFDVYKMADSRVEKMEYCKHYTESGFMQQYSNALMNLTPRTSDEIARTTLLKTDIDNAIKENLAIFITKGVTDQSWSTFIDMFKNMNVDEYISIYQNALVNFDF